MEPGHEDREYLTVTAALSKTSTASMEPGHEDREYLEALYDTAEPPRLNGARS